MDIQIGLIDYKLECKLSFSTAVCKSILSLIDYKLECKHFLGALVTIPLYTFNRLQIGM